MWHGLSAKITVFVASLNPISMPRMNVIATRRSCLPNSGYFCWWQDDELMDCTLCIAHLSTTTLNTHTMIPSNIFRLVDKNPAHSGPVLRGIASVMPSIAQLQSIAMWRVCCTSLPRLYDFRPLEGAKKWSYRIMWDMQLKNVQILYALHLLSATNLTHQFNSHATDLHDYCRTTFNSSQRVPLHELRHFSKNTNYITSELFHFFLFLIIFLHFSFFTRRQETRKDYGTTVILAAGITWRTFTSCHTAIYCGECE